MADVSLSLLRCPEDHSPLVKADEELLARINARIRAGDLVNRGGQRVERPLEGGLVREAGDLLFPVVEQIPVLLLEEAIELEG